VDLTVVPEEVVAVHVAVGLEGGDVVAAAVLAAFGRHALLEDLGHDDLERDREQQHTHVVEQFESEVVFVALPELEHLGVEAVELAADQAHDDAEQDDEVLGVQKVHAGVGEHAHLRQLLALGLLVERAHQRDHHQPRTHAGHESQHRHLHAPEGRGFLNNEADPAHRRQETG